MEGNRLRRHRGLHAGGPRDAVLPGSGGRDRGRGALRPGGRSLYPSAGQRMGSRSRRPSCSPSVGWSRISPVPMSRTTHPSAGRVIWPCVRKPAGMASCRPTSPSSVLYGGGKPGERMVNATQLCRVNGVRTADIAAADLGASRADGAGAVLPAPPDPGFEKRLHPGQRRCPRLPAKPDGSKGDYTLTEDDISAGRTFPDVMVHRANFCFDTHNPPGAAKRKASRRRAPPGLTTSRTAASFPVGWRICLRRGAVYRGHTKHIPPIG